MRFRSASSECFSFADSGDVGPFSADEGGISGVMPEGWMASLEPRIERSGGEGGGGLRDAIVGRLRLCRCQSWDERGCRSKWSGEESCCHVEVMKLGISC